MKIEIEITGILRVVEKETWNVVDLFSNDVKLGEFVFNPKHKSINVELSKCMGKILGINVTEYLDYMKLIADLGLEIPKSYRRHWTPKTEQKHYYIDFEGDICPNSVHKTGYYKTDIKRYENYNAFPTRELAEKTINISKLGRLILLWQNTNDCLFEPVWNNKRSRKHYFYYSHNLERILVGDYFDFQDDILYFETAEQVEAFITAYDKEIKKIMGVKS